MNMMSGKNILALTIVAITLLCATPHATFADSSTGTNCNQTYSSGFIPLACYSKSPLVQEAFNNTNGLPGYINSIFKITLSVGAIMAVLRIAYGGYLYMGSADMWGNKQQAKEAIGDAIVGLLLLFAIYLILNQINPNLLNLNVMSDIKPVSATQTSSTAQQAYSP
jgi:ABC-type Na+ efflux pump permease subunit